MFGSYADGSNTEQSDVDLMVEFNTDTVSLLTLSALKNSMEENLGVSVDIIHAPIDEDALTEPKKVVEIYAA